MLAVSFAGPVWNVLINLTETVITYYTHSLLESVVTWFPSAHMQSLFTFIFEFRMYYKRMIRLVLHETKCDSSRDSLLQ